MRAGSACLGSPKLGRISEVLVEAPGKHFDQPTVLIEFDSVAQAIAAHESPYQAALAGLGKA